MDQRHFSPAAAAALADAQSKQHRSKHPVVKQLDLNNSPVVNVVNGGDLAMMKPPALATNQMPVAEKEPEAKSEEESAKVTTQTKCLCGVIVALILIILGLIVFDHGYTNTADSFDRKLNLQQENRFSQSNMNQQQAILRNRAEQLTGKLLSSSPDSQLQALPGSGPSSGPRGLSTAASGSHDLDPDHLDEHFGSQDQHSPAEPENENQVGGNQDKNHDEEEDSSFGRLPVGKRRDPESICMTPGCIRASAQILNNMDNKTKPCEDFYQFACGRWIETQLIPDEKSSLSVFSQNTADLNVKLRALIERKPTGSDPPIVGQMRNMYGSCMNLTDIETRGDQPLLELLAEFGGWPVLAGSSQPQTVRRSLSESNEKFNWLETLIKFRQRGFSHDMIIDLSVVPDVRNSRRYIIDLDQSSLGLPDISYYFKGVNDTTFAAYYTLMVESAVMLGASRAEARKHMAGALEFETALARISVPREQRRNVTRLYNKMLARDLYKLAPNIDWQRYLSSLLQDDQLDLDRDEVNVKVPNFIRSIDSLLLRTDSRTLANYMMWRIVRLSMGGLSRRWRELAHGYSQVTTGRLSEEPRWEQCLNSLEGTLGSALSALYVKNHFNKQSKVAAMEMVDYIRNEFLKIIDEVDWMDDETREEAKLKARGIAPYIGYPDELLQDELIEDFFSGLQLVPVNYYQNLRNLRIWSTNYAFSQLRKPNKRGDWKKHARAAVVNAYYNSLENSIEFPAGILQGAFFDAERPNYMNFGAIGYVIGHEITHGFDDRGRQFDREGNDRNWWKPKTDARFKERAQCIVEQYGNYTVAENGLKVNGLNTQGENIADNGGIKEAYRAYRRWTKDHGREQRLPGLAYSTDQLFWISAANIWCGKFRPEVLKLRVNSGVHSPARFRIIGPLSNSAEFAQSFNCPLGSPMNPRKKCAVW